MAAYKLIYFNARGIAESIRMLLAYSGRNFEDVRVDYGDWVKRLKKETPYGKLPVLEIDGKLIHQSMAICRYLGNETKLGGSNNWENLQIDMAAETIEDFKNHFMELKIDMTGEEVKKTVSHLLDETVPYYLERFDSIIRENNGYFACGRLTWSDFCFCGFSETVENIVREKVCDKYPHAAELRRKVYSIPSVRDWLAKRPLTLL